MSDDAAREAGRQRSGFVAAVQSGIGRWFRRRRSALFFRTLMPDSNARVLDLGGGRGDHFARLYRRLTNVSIADSEQESLEFAKRQYGYRTLLLDGAATLPLADREFDIIFCSSVIEHVTGPKEQATSLFRTDGRRFATQAFVYQKQFADEIRRCGTSYFVQTPYRYFPVEVHCWIPLAGFLPTHLQWWLMRRLTRFWPRNPDQADWSLLDEKQMRELFPDAEIHRERFLLFTKSLIAIRHGARAPVAAPHAACDGQRSTP